MPRSSKAAIDLPQSIRQPLEALSAHLRLTHERRALSIRALIAEINVPVLTVMSIKRGEAAVSMAVYAAALQYDGRLEWLPGLVAHGFDREALCIELAGIRPRSARR